MSDASVLSAPEQIRNLLGLYCERMDAGDFDGLAALFEHGRLSDDQGHVFCIGSEAMAKMWRGQTMVYDGSPRTRHVTANPIIDVDDAAGTATVRSSYVVFQGLSGYGDAVLPLQPIITGRYNDRFKRGADGAWHWDERSYAIDHLGNLSYHLSRTLTT